METDLTIWSKIEPDDLWIYDKLILSKKLGHVCGPAGIPVPKTNKYIIRPITNVRGMGISTRIKELTPKNSITDVPPGYFWCEFFTGDHLSVDFDNGEFAYTIQGFKDRDSLTFTRWKKIDHIPKLPYWLSYFILKYENVNIEMIGNKIIEVHLRPNPDFHNKSYQEIEVVYDRKNVKDWFIPDFEDCDGFLEKERLGFNVIF